MCGNGMLAGRRAVAIAEVGDLAGARGGDRDDRVLLSAGCLAQGFPVK
jgi:hypothetical protein